MTSPTIDPSSSDRPSPWTITAIAVVCFLISISNPFNIAPHGPAAAASYVKEAVAAIISAFVLYAGYRSRGIFRSSNVNPSPWRFLVVGLALMLLFYMAWDLVAGFRLRAGLGVSLSGFYRGYPKLGLILFAAPLFMLYRRSSMDAAWRYVSLVAAILMTLLTAVGVGEMIDEVVFRRTNQYLFSERLQLIAIYAITPLGGLGLLGCFLTMAWLALRDRRQGAALSRWHYVAIGAAILIIALPLLAPLMLLIMYASAG
jgi:hypothetical protein